ncbi:radical SAM protein [Microbispora sp. CA-102843]|uniref:radical SAM protein n=1 Tax=Microbispora sp. CA-102843 TaxID=3239952 RepID=UPI003D8E438B
MNKGQHRGPEARPRVIGGERGWWFLGPGGIARLKTHHLTPARELRPEAERVLRERGLFSPPAYRSYSLTVLTSTNCNLGCAYCFQNTAQDAAGGSRPPRIAYSRLTSATIDLILGFTRRRQAEAGLDSLVLMLFGGEPLLNPRACVELLERAGALGLRWASMTSNGTLMTVPLARRLAGLGLRDVQVTFDGDRADHDRIRVRRVGGGTFDDIVAAMAAMTAATPIRCDIRVNVSHHNYARIDTLVERLGRDLDPSRCSLYFARVGDVGVGYDNDLIFSEDMAARFNRWQRRALELGFAVPRPRAHTPCQACSYRDGRYGAVVNADGTLSSCWETAGKPDWQVGTVRDGYLPADRTAGRWISCEESYQYAGDLSELTRFQDDVDAALLDYLSATGRLGSGTA